MHPGDSLARDETGERFDGGVAASWATRSHRMFTAHSVAVSATRAVYRAASRETRRTKTPSSPPSAKYPHNAQVHVSVSFSRWLNFAAERRLRNGAKTKAGPLEAEQLSRLRRNAAKRLGGKWVKLNYDSLFRHTHIVRKLTFLGVQRCGCVGIGYPRKKVIQSQSLKNGSILYEDFELRNKVAVTFPTEGIFSKLFLILRFLVPIVSRLLRGII